jgi:predicted metal-dependent HD superfamily phosphohydrolase
MRYRMPQKADISKLEAQWHAFFPRRDRDLIAGIWAEVRDKYSEPQRFYHHLGHLVDLFEYWDRYYAHLHHPRVVGLVLVGHDVLYDIGAQDNEERSAVYTGERLERLGEDPATVSRVMELIRMTAVHACPRDDPDAALMLDMDMAIIGAPPNDYDRYAQAIEAEYSQIYAPEAFWRGRLSRFIDLLLQQPRLFKTDLFENALGPRARANLTREKQALLDRLRGLEHDVGHPRR